jgi:hypothetical protein
LGVGSGAVAASAEIRLKKKRRSGRMKGETGWQAEGFNRNGCRSNYTDGK